MNEAALGKKEKIELGEYDFPQDLAARLYLSQLSPFEVEVIEELNLRPLQLSITEFSSEIDKSIDRIFPIFQDLQKLNLLKMSGDLVLLNKEMRKYFEHSLELFDQDFTPDLLFVYQNFRKIPIHCLSTWYALPKNSNNLFQSLLDKYLLTPSLYEKYLQEVQLEGETMEKIKETLLGSENLQLSVDEIQKRFHLTKESLEKTLILLEFFLVGVTYFVRQGDGYERIFSMLHEYRTYQKECQQRALSSIAAKKISCTLSAPFGFIEDLDLLLIQAKRHKVELIEDQLPPSFLAILAKKSTLIDPKSLQEHFAHIVQRGLQLGLLVRRDNMLVVSVYEANKWHALSLEERSIYLLYHPKNRFFTYDGEVHLLEEKHLKDAQKAICQAIPLGFVELEKLLDVTSISLGSQKGVHLKRSGVRYRYQSPQYSMDERKLLRATYLETFFESGFIEKGISEQGAICIRTTSFGNSVYG